MPKEVSFRTEFDLFPAPLEGGVENYKETDFPTIVAWGNFPAPREAWVSSYESIRCGDACRFRASGPSRGWGGFLL